MEAINKLKAKQQVISSMKQEAHASWTEMKQQVLRSIAPQGINWEVRDAAESSVICQLQCQVAAGHQKLERQAAQHSSRLSEANAELQCEREACIKAEADCDFVRHWKCVTRARWVSWKGRLAELADSHSAALQAVESCLQAETWAADGKALQATIKELQQLMSDKGDELERAAGAKDYGDGKLKHDDSQLNRPTPHSMPRLRGANQRSEKALLEKQESLDKKAMECGVVTRKVDALESSYAQLKACFERGEKCPGQQSGHCYPGICASAASKAARKRSKTEVPEAQASSEASPEDEKTPVVDTRAFPSPKGASRDTSEVSRSEAASSSSALSLDDATASSAGGETEGEGWMVVHWLIFQGHVPCILYKIPLG
ncbi:TPA: hypothetical protein ACH3X1_010973 [Trebouxia sp. C0004]